MVIDIQLLPFPQQNILHVLYGSVAVTSKMVLSCTAVVSQMVPSSAYLVSDCSIAGIFLQQLHHSLSEAFPGSHEELAHYWGLLLPRLLLHVIRDATSQRSSLRCTTLLLLHCRGGRSASPLVGVPRPTTPPLC